MEAVCSFCRGGSGRGIPGGEASASPAGGRKHGAAAGNRGIGASEALWSSGGYSRRPGRRPSAKKGSWLTSSFASGVGCTGLEVGSTKFTWVEGGYDEENGVAHWELHLREFGVQRIYPHNFVGEFVDSSRRRECAGALRLVDRQCY